jgi:hypothetical protein
MRTKIFSILSLAALILAVIVSMTSHATIVANQPADGLQAADILSLTKAAKDMPAQQYPAH